MVDLPFILALDLVEYGWWASGSLLFGILGYFVAGSRGNSCLGCVLGLLLGPLGLLIAVLMPRNR